MSNEEFRSGEDAVNSTDVERALSDLSRCPPRPLSLDRDTLMYQAGFAAASQASAASHQSVLQRRVRIWQAATGLAVAASLLIAVFNTRPTSSGLAGIAAVPHSPSEQSPSEQSASEQSPSERSPADIEVTESVGLDAAAGPSSGTGPTRSEMARFRLARSQWAQLPIDSKSNYVTLRAAAIRYGVDAMLQYEATEVTFHSPSSAGHSTAGNLLRQMLRDSPARMGAAPADEDASRTRPPASRLPETRPPSQPANGDVQHTPIPLLSSDCHPQEPMV